MDETVAGTWRREVGRRMVAFVRAVGGLMTRYESIKRAPSRDEASLAEVACDAALGELEQLSVALRHLRRSLHGAPVEPEVAPATPWTSARDSTPSSPHPP